jgi:hypothetical protein
MRQFLVDLSSSAGVEGLNEIIVFERAKGRRRRTEPCSGATKGWKISRRTGFDKLLQHELNSAVKSAVCDEFFHYFLSNRFV